jgi:hypothetical protein
MRGTAYSTTPKPNALKTFDVQRLIRKSIMSTLSIGAPADFNYDQLLRDHLDKVFNERNACRRLNALTELYNDDAIVVDPDGTRVGHQAISQLVDDVLQRFPDNFSFTVTRSGMGLGGVGYLPWQLGPSGGPAMVTGVDVAHISAGRIQAIYVLIDTATS